MSGSLAKTRPALVPLLIVRVLPVPPVTLGEARTTVPTLVVPSAVLDVMARLPLVTRTCPE